MFNFNNNIVCNVQNRMVAGPLLMQICSTDTHYVHCTDAAVGVVVSIRIGTHFICFDRFARQLFTMTISTALTSNDGKQEEHDGVEEA